MTDCGVWIFLSLRCLNISASLVHSTVNAFPRGVLSRVKKRIQKAKGGEKRQCGLIR